MEKYFKNLLLIITFLIPSYIFRFSIFGIKTNFFEILVLLLFIVYLSEKRERKKLLLSKQELYSLILFLFSVLTSIVMAKFSLQALGIFKGWFLIPLIYGWLIYQNFSSKELFKISLALYVSLLLVSILALLQKAQVITTLFYQSGDPSFAQYLQEGRLFGIFESPNYLAMFLVPLFFLSLILLQHTKKSRDKYIFLVSLILPLLALYFTASRAGFIALLLSAFLGYIFYAGKRLMADFQQSIAPFLVAFFSMLNLSYFYFSIHNYQASKGGDLVRIEIYKYALKMLKTNWLAGIGLGNFQDKIAALSRGDVFFTVYGYSYALHPHNLLMAIWLNLGLLGIIAFLWLLYNLFSRLFQNINFVTAALTAALIAILIHGLFDTTYFKNDLSVIFWLICALTLILSKETKKGIDA